MGWLNAQVKQWKLYGFIVFSFTNPCPFFSISHRLSLVELRPSSSLSTGRVVSLRGDWAIFCHAGSERVGRVWSVRGKIPWSTPSWLGIEPGPRGGQTVSYSTERSWLTNPCYVLLFGIPLCRDMKEIKWNELSAEDSKRLWLIAEKWTRLDLYSDSASWQLPPCHHL